MLTGTELKHACVHSTDDGWHLISSSGGCKFIPKSLNANSASERPLSSSLRFALREWAHTISALKPKLWCCNIGIKAAAFGPPAPAGLLSGNDFPRDEHLHRHPSNKPPAHSTDLHQSFCSLDMQMPKNDENCKPFLLLHVRHGHCGPRSAAGKQ